MTVINPSGTVTAVCKDGADEFDDCHPVTMAPETSPKSVLHKRVMVTVTNNGCTAVCWDTTPSPACDIQCKGGFAAQVPLPTPKPTIKPFLQRKGLTTTNGDCTAVCWDQYPGTGCDIQCRDASITKMPEPTSGVSSLWTTTLTTGGCTFFCQDLYPGHECAVQCSGTLPTHAFGKVVHFFVPAPTYTLPCSSLMVMFTVKPLIYSLQCPSKLLSLLPQLKLVIRLKV